MRTLTPAGFDAFARHTDTNGSSHVQQHRVWDRDRFFAARRAEAAKANTDALKKDRDAPALAKVEPITEEQFRDARKR